jgi:ferredoxin
LFSQTRRKSVIVAELKQISEIRKMIDRYSSILVVGCDSCVAECASGGNRETMLLAAVLRLSYKNDNKYPIITDVCLDRQCVDDFIDRIAHRFRNMKWSCLSAAALEYRLLLEYTLISPLFLLSILSSSGKRK